MKIQLALFLVLLLEMQLAYGQKAIEKADSVIYGKDKKVAVLYLKNKVGFYDLEKDEFILKMSKPPIIPLVEMNLFLLPAEGKTEIFLGNVQLNGQDELEQFKKLNTCWIDKNQLLINRGGSESKDIFPLHEKSGVFDVAEKRWIIPEIYNEIQFFQQVLICQKIYGRPILDEIQDGPELFPEYDIYTRNKAGKWVLSKEGLRNSQEMIRFIFGQENVLSENKGRYVVRTKTGVGLIKFQAADYDPENPSFLTYKWLIKPNNKCVLPSHDFELIGVMDSLGRLQMYAFDNETSQPRNMGTGKNHVFIDGAANTYTFFIHDDQEDTLETAFYYDARFRFGLSKVTDKLIKITDYEVYESYPLHGMYGEDSINYDGEPVYEAQDPFMGSGVFNTSTFQWELEPKYWNVYPAVDNGWLVSYLTNAGPYPNDFDEKFYFTGAKDYSFGADVTYFELLADTNRLRELVDEKIDRFFPAPQSTMEHGEKSFYAKSEKQLMLITPEYDQYDEIIFVSEKADFVHINGQLRFSVYLSDSVWIATYQDTIITIDQYANWKLVEEWKEGARTIRVKQPKFKVEAIDPYFSVEMIDSLIVVNDVFAMPYRLEDGWGEYYEMGFDDQEASAIWKLTENGWDKVSPYYASIEVVPNGFIARTKSYSGELLVDGGEGWATFDESGNVAKVNQKEARYIYLDKALNPLSFIDFYDFKNIRDLGFGLQFETDKGAMFVTYEGQALTNDEWQDFELEDGKVKAIQYTAIFDEFGDFIYDEKGNIVDDPIGKVEYFELPKK